MSIPSRTCVVFYIVLATFACEGSGTTETVGTLRAEHIEIVDQSGSKQVDVAKQLELLEQRVSKLESELAQQPQKTGETRPSGAPPAEATPPEAASTAASSTARVHPASPPSSPPRRTDAGGPAFL